jgi:bifunctional NMN adenylyltransferase/nudix hydrolase
MNNTGVIIARFQSPYLHKGHFSLINSVADRHNKVVIVLGVSPVLSKRNPFDFHTREKMMKQDFPNMIVLPVADHPSDDTWSENLDTILSNTFPTEKFTLYGSRDSFLSYYSGRHQTDEAPVLDNWNASAIREELSDQVFGSQDFRAGINYARHNTYDKVYPTVDIAVFKDQNQYLLMGQKARRTQWRLIGGFVDPTDANLETAARRELAEEAGPIEIGDLHYEGSFLVDDWRYRQEKDKIMTTMFSTEHLYGMPTPADDIVKTAWIKTTDLAAMMEAGEIVNEHFPLVQHLIENKLKDAAVNS